MRTIHFEVSIYLVEAAKYGYSFFAGHRRRRRRRLLHPPPPPPPPR